MTSEEKWVYLVNHNRQKYRVPRGEDRFSKKVISSVWWNSEAMFHFELLPNDCAVNTELYCHQLNRVYGKLNDKYPTLFRRKHALFQQDNAKPRSRKENKGKI